MANLDQSERSIGGGKLSFGADSLASFRSSGVDTIAEKLSPLNVSNRQLLVRTAKSIADFQMGENIGEGTFARVYVW